MGDGWGIKWRSHNRLDGKREYLMGRMGSPDVPPYVAGHTTMVFRTRKEAREHIQHRFGYIAARKDLRAEPHGWKTPIPVRVVTTVKMVKP